MADFLRSTKVSDILQSMAAAEMNSRAEGGVCWDKLFCKKPPAAAFESRKERIKNGITGFAVSGND
ncbi:MAG: hypothetical protein NC400_01945 [Clostridium sp.]|nr:hypothetical protein [Clostridium sp.]